MSSFANGRWCVVAAACAACVNAAVSAEFVGFELKEITASVPGADPATEVVYELYAKFDHPDDVVINTFQVDIGATHPFVHLLDGFGESSSLPLKKADYDSLGTEVDTYVTIGLPYAGTAGNPNRLKNKTLLDPDFLNNETLFLEDAQVPGGWLANEFPFQMGKAGLYANLEVRLARFAFTKNGSAPVVFGHIGSTFIESNGDTGQEEVVFAGPDCNNNGIADVVDIANGEPDATDCNGNGTIDSCEVSLAGAADINEDGVPDDCQQFLGDLDHDIDVDGADLGILLSFWGAGDTPYDLNGDDNVNGTDLGILLANWTD
jgi:hypothetical protein